MLGLTATIPGSNSQAKSEENIQELCSLLNNAVILTEKDLSQEAYREFVDCKPAIQEVEETVPTSSVEEWYAETCDKVAQLIRSQMQRTSLEKQDTEQHARSDSDAVYGDHDTHGAHETRSDACRSADDSMHESCSPEQRLYKELVDLVLESKRVADDCGVYDALSFLAEGYLTLIWSPAWKNWWVPVSSSV